MERLWRMPVAVIVAMAAALTVCAAVAAVSLARVGRAEVPARIAPLAGAQEESIQDNAPPAQSGEAPDRALAATLRVDLFPKPPEPPAEASAVAREEPPRLEIELVAILLTGVGETASRRVFLYDPKAQSYITLSPGDRLREGVTLSSIDDQSATFAIARGQRTVPLRLELKP